jgi:AAA15 family ATPase/GTPase
LNENSFVPKDILKFYAFKKNILPLKFKEDGSIDIGYCNVLFGKGIDSIFFDKNQPIRIFMNFLLGSEAKFINYEEKYSSDSNSTDVNFNFTSDFNPENSKIAFSVSVRGANDTMGRLYVRLQSYPFNPFSINSSRPVNFVFANDYNSNDSEIIYNRIFKEGKLPQFKKLLSEIFGVGIEDFRILDDKDSASKDSYITTTNGEIIPISQLGFGSNRIVTVLLKIFNSENGMVLIDEVDLGIHYSLQEKFWTIVFELSQKLNVQIFATTHSRDCFNAFARVANQEENLNEGRFIRLQQNGDLTKVIDYDDNLMLGAARFGDEVR